MKIRTGFVSNSSSSSFLVGFSEEATKSVESVHQYLFGRPLAEALSMSAPYEDEAFSSVDVAIAVHRTMQGTVVPDDWRESLGRVGSVEDLKDRDDFLSIQYDPGSLLTRDECVQGWNLMQAGWDNEDHLYDKIHMLRTMEEEGKQDSVEYRELQGEVIHLQEKRDTQNDEATALQMGRVQERMPADLMLYRFEYGNDGGDDPAAFEHMDIFYRVPHVKFCHH
jgi:hypothetical protein